MPVAAGEIQKQFWTAPDFLFHTGERLDKLRIGYLAFGNPSGTPVLVLHGTNSSSVNLLNAAFADPLFKSGQPLDAATHWITHAPHPHGRVRRRSRLQALRRLRRG
ncbi:MAG: hypothetical protein R3317_08030, partial [Burkholderiaceae bacterium]|nr:hypothetical protein [Burkholderiaceae bacterium]